MSKLIVGLLLSCALISCSGDDKSNSDAPPLREYLFGIEGYEDGSEDFVAATDDETVIAALDAQLSLPIDERTMFINGDIAAGDAGYNLPWSWHFVESEWELTEFAIEVCDGLPSFVEDDLDYWLNTVGSFCPWGAYVKEAL